MTKESTTNKAIAVKIEPFILYVGCSILSLNRDRGEPCGSSPPTPPGIRITYQGGSVDYSGPCADQPGVQPERRSGPFASPLGPSHHAVRRFKACCSFHLLTFSYRSGLQRRHNRKLFPFRPRVSATCSFDMQGGFLVRPCRLPLRSVSFLLVCPLLTSLMRSGSIALPSAPPTGGAHERPPGVRHRAFRA